MRHCSNCNKTHGPLKRYMWNVRNAKGLISSSHSGLLCETCAKSLGAWEVLKQPYNQQLIEEEAKAFDEINSIIEQRTN